MDSSFTIKPGLGVQKFAPQDRKPAREAIKTELAATKTVEQVSGGPDHQERHPDHMPHDVVVDPEAREVINRENDVRAHEGEPPHPDQALARLRAYRPAHTESDTAPTNEPHANIKA